jgi:hypothetical protein
MHPNPSELKFSPILVGEWEFKKQDLKCLWFKFYESIIKSYIDFITLVSFKSYKELYVFI